MYKSIWFCNHLDILLINFILWAWPRGLVAICKDCWYHVKIRVFFTLCSFLSSGHKLFKHIWFLFKYFLYPFKHFLNSATINHLIWIIKLVIVKNGISIHNVQSLGISDLNTYLESASSHKEKAWETYQVLDL